ncbi:response regulator, partial [Sinorhizobium meliloti]
MIEKSMPAPNTHAADADLIGPDKSLLIVDDDTAFLRRLARAMEARGFAVEIAESVAEGIAKAKTRPPKHAVIDLR